MKPFRGKNNSSLVDSYLFYILFFILFIQGCAGLGRRPLQSETLSPSSKIGVRALCDFEEMKWYCKYSEAAFFKRSADNFKEVFLNEFTSRFSKLVPVKIVDVTDIKVNFKNYWVENKLTFEEYRIYNLDYFLLVSLSLHIDDSGEVRINHGLVMHRIVDKKIIWLTSHQVSCGKIKVGDPCSIINEKLDSCIDAVVDAYISTVK